MDVRNYGKRFVCEVACLGGILNTMHLIENCYILYSTLAAYVAHYCTSYILYVIHDLENFKPRGGGFQCLQTLNPPDMSTIATATILHGLLLVT